MKEKDGARKNLKDYLQGKSKLKYGVMPHPTGDTAFDFIKSRLNKNRVTSFNEWLEINFSK